MKTPRDALSRILEVLDLLEIPYLIGGSLASSAHGISRPTLDADLVIDLPAGKTEEFAALLTPDFYADVQMIREALAAGRAFNVIHYDSTYKFDFFPLRKDEFSRVEFGRRIFIECRSLGNEPLECAMATAEDVILRKLLWYRAGGEVSERQWNDVRGIVRLKGEALDVGYLHKWAVYLRVDDLLERLLKE